MEATAETGALRSALSAQSNYQEDRRGKMEDGRKGTANPNIPTFRHSNTPQSGLSIIPSFQYSSTETKAFTSFSHHLLDLTPGLDRLFKGLRESTRRNIRKSEKEGVSVRFATDLGAVETYFRLHCLTRKRHGVPPQPYSFFAKLHQHLIAPGQGMVALAEYQGLAVAGAIFLTLGDRAIFKFGASDSRYHLQRPNDRIMWEAIRRLAESGLGSLSFGRTDLSHKGLIQFKSSWGGGEKISFYVRFGLMVGDNVWNSVDSHPLVSRIFQKLPTPLLRLFGHVFYKHFGV
jgi:lipid II:glycine glycyltransferase (peptidoglycan interpeptide bridge formation enzyme)